MPETISDDAALYHKLVELRSNQEQPLYLAIDGHSGSGKSTLARHLQSQLGQTTIVEGDDFYLGGSPSTWDKRSVAANADSVIDRQTLAGVIQSLQQNGTAQWQAFNWNSDQWDSDTPARIAQSADEKSVVIVEGVYTAMPALADYFACRILCDVPASLSSQRCKERDGDDFCPNWAKRWGDAESHYFEKTLSRTDIDLIYSPVPSADRT